MKNLVLSVLILLQINVSKSQSIPDDSLYFGLEQPADEAVIFAPDIISLSNRKEHAGIFSSDGSEFYYTTNNSMTYVKKYRNSKWSTDSLAPFSSLAGGAREASFYNHDSCVMFATTDGYTSDNWVKTDFWMASRNGESWNNPIKLNSQINSIDVQWHPTLSNSGTLYFGSRGSIYKSTMTNDTVFNSPLKVDFSNINLAGSSNADPFIAGDESYLIFASNRSGGYGQQDLYISFKNQDQIWSSAVNLGPKINSTLFDVSPFVTPDSKFLFFSRHNGNENTEDIYWVSTDFIEELRSTTSTKETKELTYRDYNIYPNPVYEILNISFNDKIAPETNLELISIDGKTIFSSTYHNSSFIELAIPKNLHGIYILKIKIDDVYHMEIIEIQ